MMTYDEWVKGKEYVTGKQAYEAGQASQQKRIDELEDQVEKKQTYGNAWKQISVNGQCTISELKDEVSLFRIALSGIINHLPTNRDWLDPVLEKAARNLVNENPESTLKDLKNTYGIKT